MGPSGSGKSTLMHCLAGLDRPTAGQAYVDGRLVSDMPEKQLTELRRHTVGFVFQSVNLAPTLTAEENILLPALIAGEGTDREWFRSIVAALDLEDRLGHLPKQLSGGQQQRVACARALMTRPDMVGLAWRSVRSHPARFALSLAAVVLGVAFVSGTLTVRAMMAQTFASLAASAKTADVYVQRAGPAVPEMGSRVNDTLAALIQPWPGAAGVAPEEVKSAVEAVLPADDAIGATLGGAVREAQRTRFDASFGFIGLVVLALAVAALLVGALIIADTFAMIVREQLRSMAILRALGASSRQVATTVLVQAAVAAALLPARRATRLPVLEAIAEQ
jgi:ABC-type multidrug transport system fused ATPase/permease subunit